MARRIASFLRSLPALVRRRRIDEELETELAAHVEMEAEENQRRGMSPAEARRAALRDFGGVTGFITGSGTAARSDGNYWAITVGLRAPI